MGGRNKKDVKTEMGCTQSFQKKGAGDKTVDSRYLEFQGTLLNTSRYPYLDILDLQNCGKNI